MKEVAPDWSTEDTPTHPSLLKIKSSLRASATTATDGNVLALHPRRNVESVGDTWWEVPEYVEDPD